MISTVDILLKKYLVVYFERFFFQVKLAKSALKRLKTLRHPNVVTYVDSLEVRNAIFNRPWDTECTLRDLGHRLYDDGTSLPMFYISLFSLD